MRSSQMYSKILNGAMDMRESTIGLSIQNILIALLKHMRQFYIHRGLP
jgi:hypothetical protein